MGVGCSREFCSAAARLGSGTCGDGLKSEPVEIVDEGMITTGDDWLRQKEARDQHLRGRDGLHDFYAEVPSDFEEELQYAKLTLQLPTILGEKSKQPRPKQFFPEDSADCERPARIRAGEGAFPPGLAWCDVELSEVDVEVEPALATPGGRLDFMARSQLSARVALRCNGQDFASFCPGPSYKLFSFQCPSEAHVGSIEVCLESSQEASLQLSPSYGLRLHDKDLQLALSVHGQPAADDVKDIEDLAAFTSALSIQAAQLGCLQSLPRGLSFRAEKSIAFMAFGRTGAENMDVYLNGLTVPCATDLRLGSGPAERRLYRYVVIPVSCEIRSVVIRLRLNGHQGAGAIIDRSFGIRVSGSDALSSVVHVDPKTYVMTSRTPCGPAAEGALQAGCWTLDGFYYMLAYRRSSKKNCNNQDARGLKGSMQL